MSDESPVGPGIRRVCAALSVAAPAVEAARAAVEHLDAVLLLESDAYAEVLRRAGVVQEAPNPGDELAVLGAELRRLLDAATVLLEDGG